MSPQVAYALRKAGVMILLAALGAAGLQVTNVIDVAGVDATIWGPIAGGLIAGAVRWAEGIRDGDRAAAGLVIPSDVQPLDSSKPSRFQSIHQRIDSQLGDDLLP